MGKAYNYCLNSIALVDHLGGYLHRLHLLPVLSTAISVTPVSSVYMCTRAPEQAHARRGRALAELGEFDSAVEALATAHRKLPPQTPHALELMQEHQR